jgi:hypothetical protein
VQLRTRSDVAFNADAYQSERSGVFRKVIYSGLPTVPCILRFCQTVRKCRSGQRANDQRKIVLYWRQREFWKFGGKHARRYLDGAILL